MPIDLARARQATLAFAVRLTAAACPLLATATALAAPTAPTALAAPTAPASTSDGDHALALYRQSTVAYNEGRFQEAIDLLSKAYALAKQPVLLFNLARAYEGLGDLPKAIESYKSYLASEPNATDRGSIEQRIETLQKQIDERAALERQRDEERRNAEAARREEEAARQRDQAKARPRPSAAPWIVAGVGAAGVGTGVVLGLLANSRYQAAVAEPYKAPAQEKYSAAQTDATIANIAYVSGGVLAATGVVWGLLDVRASHVPAESGAAASGTRLVVGIGSVALHQTF